MAKLHWFAKEVMKNIDVRTKTVMDRIGRETVEDIKKSMVAGDFKPWKSKKGDGTIHWSSQPDTPPAPDTKDLQKSIKYEVSKNENGTNNVIIYTDSIYSRSMEFGTNKGWGPVAPRPYMRPAIEKIKLKALKYVELFKVRDYS